MASHRHLATSIEKRSPKQKQHFLVSHLKAKLDNGSLVESKKMKKIFVTSLILCLGVFKLVVQCEIWTDKIVERKNVDSIRRLSKG